MRSSSVRSIRSAIIREIGSEGALESITEKSTPSPSAKPPYTKESILALLERNHSVTPTEEDVTSPHDSGRHSGSGESRASLNGVGSKEELDQMGGRPVSMTPHPNHSRPSSNGKVSSEGEEKKDRDNSAFQDRFEEIWSEKTPVTSRAVSRNASRVKSPEVDIRALFDTPTSTTPPRPNSTTKGSPRQQSDTTGLSQNFGDQSMRSDPKHVTFGDIFSYRSVGSRDGSLKEDPVVEESKEDKEEKGGDKTEEEVKEKEEEEEEKEKEEKEKEEKENEEKEKEETEKEEKEKEEKKEEEEEKEEEKKEEEKKDEEERKEEEEKEEKKERKEEGKDEDEEYRKESTTDQSPHRSTSPRGIAVVPAAVPGVTTNRPSSEHKASSGRLPFTERRRLRRPRQQRPLLRRGETEEVPKSAEEPKEAEKAAPRKLRLYKHPRYAYKNQKYTLRRKPKGEDELQEDKNSQNKGADSQEDDDHNNNKKNNKSARKPRARYSVGSSIFGQSSTKIEEPTPENEEDVTEASEPRRRLVRKTRFVRRNRPKEERDSATSTAPSSPQDNKSNGTEQNSAVASEDDSSKNNRRHQEEGKKTKKKGNKRGDRGGDTNEEPAMLSENHNKELLSEVRNLLNEVKKQREDFRLEIRKLSRDISRTAPDRGGCCSGRRSYRVDNDDRPGEKEEEKEEVEVSEPDPPVREHEDVPRYSRSPSVGKQEEEEEKEVKEEREGPPSSDARYSRHQRKTYSRRGRLHQRKTSDDISTP